MTMKIVLKLCLMMAVILSLHSCNTEEDYLNRTKDDHEPKKFSVFVSNGDEPLDYSKGFKRLMEKYDEINAEQHTLKALNHAWENKTEMSSEYVEFNIRSQDITVKENDLYIVFPLIKDNQVEGLVAAIVKNNKTWVEFIKINPEIETDYYQRVFTLFKMQYDKSIIQKKSLNKGAGGHCGFPGVPPCDIDEVIITLPNPDQPGSGWDGFPPGGVMASGECSKYQDCLHNDFLDGGGGGSENPADSTQVPKTPCENLKAQNLNHNFKAKLDILKTKTGNSSESGYRAGGPVPGSGQTGTQYQELSNKPGTNILDFKIFNTTYGIMHSHYDGLVPIFSPGDINLFIQLLQNAQVNNIPLSEVFLSVVTSQGIYQLRGDSIDVGSLNMYMDTQIDVLNDTYLTKMGNANISTADLQKEFLKFMKDNMNINGAKLYETNSDGSSKQLLLNGNNLTTLNCP